ncbi:MAG: KH domain-containing protein [Candidatus Moranbacteria bacterium]|jgi:spoIIIJ-associated protein|nr:KH domain-containing protein [Candidatus Moranbacteria bacterium]
MTEFDQKKKALEEIIKEILNRMGISGKIFLTANAFDESKAILVEIQSEDSSYLIGKFGINLNSLQHICRLIARKKIGEEINFSIDVNNYRQKQIQGIIDLANTAIQEVIEKKEPVKLRPMNAFERRLVHVQVSENDKVVSESAGEGENRSVTIKPAE